VGPFGDAEGAVVVLLLDCVADVDEFAVFEDEEVVFLGEGLEAGDCFFAEVGEDVDVGFDYGDVGAQTWRRKEDVSLRIGLEGSLLDERSARSRSSLVVVTSAETVTLLFLASATWKSRRARGLGWLSARTA
jgi:hypothetical protein